MKKALMMIAAVSMALVVFSACSGKGKDQLPKKDLCLQLYSLRQLIGNPELYAQNHEAVFKQLKEMGYTSGEAASYADGKFYGVSPEQFKADLAAAGLTALSTHTNHQLTPQESEAHDFTAALEWWKEAIAAAKAAGMKYVVIPSSSVPTTLAELQTRCDYFNEIGKLCNAAGLKMGYHSHSHEFRQVEGVKMLDYMIEHIDAANMFFQMDVYWAVYGQQSPVEYFQKYPGRFTMLHIKDKYQIGQSGMVGFEAIFNNAELAGMKDFVVELEGMPKGQDIMDGVRESAEYLLKAPFVKESYNN